METINSSSEINQNSPHSLLLKIEDFVCTSSELYKQKTIEKVANTTSHLISKMMIAFIIIMMIVITSVGLSLWIGEELGKTYLGFFCVALGYVVLYFVLLIALNPIKIEIKNKIINKLLN